MLNATNIRAHAAPRQQAVSATAYCQPWCPNEPIAKLTLFQPGSYPGIDQLYWIHLYQISLDTFLSPVSKGCLRHGASFIFFRKYQPQPRSQIFSIQNSSHNSKGQKNQIPTTLTHTYENGLKSIF